MWKASGNNMVMGTDLTVDTSSTAKQLFSLTTSGQAKLQSTVYTKFKGEIFRSINCEKEKNRNTFSLSSSRQQFFKLYTAECGANAFVGIFLSWRDHLSSDNYGEEL